MCLSTKRSHISTIYIFLTTKRKLWLFWLTKMENRKAKTKTNSIYLDCYYSQNKLLQPPSPSFLVSLETQAHQTSSSQLLLEANVPVDSYADCFPPHGGLLRCLVSQPRAANLTSVFLVACVLIRQCSFHQPPLPHISTARWRSPQRFTWCASPFVNEWPRLHSSRPFLPFGVRPGALI